MTNLILTKTEPMEHLINSACGQYGANALLEIYSDQLYVKDGTRGYVPFAKYLASSHMIRGETITTVFDPDNEHFHFNLDHIIINMELSIKSDSGFWHIEFIEGDIWAINPNAVWDDAQDMYVLDNSND